jgi:Zn-dependent peptidase ImmA (M78 family)
VVNSGPGKGERAGAMFRDAARRAVLGLTNAEVDDLSHRVALAFDVLGNMAPTLDRVTAGLVLRPSAELAAVLATRLRGLMGAGDIYPLFDLPSLLDERLGRLRFPVGNNKLDGGCAVIDGGAFIFVSDVDRDDVLFICAHELGHLAAMYARRVNEDGAVLDPTGDIGAGVKGPYEHFADVFASELLIPARGLGMALGKIRALAGVPGGSLGDIELLYLSRIFGVPFLAAAKRCERATLLPKGGAATMNRYLVERFDGPERRAEELGLPPRIKLEFAALPRSVERAIIKQAQDVRAAARQAAARGRAAKTEYKQGLLYGPRK